MDGGFQYNVPRWLPFRRAASLWSGEQEATKGSAAIDGRIQQERT